ncbi:rotamase [Sinimarinibacterium sp. CAU 1509]|uniref:peptidylprolyl isomerase n=1 Tax=Sinimarinibacterium sp. CAU 1509 TaxID=2562283 RepID=UPI0010AC7E01|nr:peptidylprolyl isomerase [Sinimarinibacterium sp. CAU 1509]TJY56248.1 rotamase [Sinimarinibacterium sp. CAU 1509]
MTKLRDLPVVVNAGALPEATQTKAAAHVHVHANAPSRPLPGPAPVYVRVADAEISEAEIAREMQHHPATSPQRARADAARALVVRELLRRETERLGLPAEVEPADGEPLEEACIRALIEREVATPEPSEEACRHYYENNRERLRQPDRVRARHILLAAAPGDDSAREHAGQLGKELIAELREHPERFTEFAMRHSACPSRDDGGELGWIERGQTTPEFERQLHVLKPGLAGLTIESRYGHHVVWVDETVRGAALSFDEAADRIAAYLETQVKQNALHQYLQILRERYPVIGLDELEATA